MKYYISFFKRALNFKGISSRKELWYPTLINAIIATLLTIFFTLSVKNSLINTIVGSIEILFFAITIIPSISVAVRRLHDADHYGYNLFWFLLPVFGTVIAIYLLCKPTIYNPQISQQKEHCNCCEHNHNNDATILQEHNLDDNQKKINQHNINQVSNEHQQTTQDQTDIKQIN